MAGSGQQFVQGGAFGGLSFQPLGWDAPFGSTPAANSATQPETSFTPQLPAIGGSGSQAISSAASAAGITGGSVPPSGTTGATTQTAASSWFARGAVVVLGFIFVAVGLSQFERGQNVVRAAIGKI